MPKGKGGVAMGGENRYFNEALSGFAHDIASGAAIRHLIDKGYSITRIMDSLTYPTPRERVEKTALRYMLDSGILLERAENNDKNTDKVNTKSYFVLKTSIGEAWAELGKVIAAWGRKNSYVKLPLRALREQPLYMAELSMREREYILDIPDKNDEIYHRLSENMEEISVNLAVHKKLDMECLYFPKTFMRC